MTKQDQKVSDNSIALQSGGDTNIVTYNGLSGDQVLELVGKMTSLVGTEKILQEMQFRVKELEALVSKALLKPDTRVDPVIINDPDFCLAGRDAFLGYARCGDKDTLDVLVELICKRASSANRTRKTLVLNDAIRLIPQLTKNEIAAMTVAFILCEYEYQAQNVRDLGIHFSKTIGPLLDDISTGESSYAYIESKACARIFVQRSLVDVVNNAYYRVLNMGSERQHFYSQLSPYLTEEIIDSMLIVSNYTPDRYVFNAQSDRAIRKTLLAEAGRLIEPNLEHIVQAIVTTMSRNEGGLKEVLSPNFSGLNRLFQIWESCKISALKNNAVGQVIAIAKLKQLGLTLDIDLWID